MSRATLAAVAEHSELASEITVLESDRLYLLLSFEKFRRVPRDCEMNLDVSPRLEALLTRITINKTEALI